MKDGPGLSIFASGPLLSAGCNSGAEMIYYLLLVVLDGELAVPCSPRSALAGLNPL